MSLQPELPEASACKQPGDTHILCGGSGMCASPKELKRYVDTCSEYFSEPPVSSHEILAHILILSALLDILKDTHLAT